LAANNDSEETYSFVEGHPFIKIFCFGGRAFHSKIIDAISVMENTELKKDWLQKLFDWLPSYKCTPGAVKILQVAKNLSTWIPSNYRQGIAGFSDYTFLNRQEAVFMLSSMIELDCLKPQFIKWMSLDYLSELRKAERYIEMYCRIRFHESCTLGIFGAVLS
jgi:hypothetical protein